MPITSSLTRSLVLKTTFKASWTLTKESILLPTLGSFKNTSNRLRSSPPKSRTLWGSSRRWSRNWRAWYPRRPKNMLSRSSRSREREPSMKRDSRERLKIEYPKGTKDSMIQLWSYIKTLSRWRRWHWRWLKGIFPTSIRGTTMLRKGCMAILTAPKTLPKDMSPTNTKGTLMQPREHMIKHKSSRNRRTSYKGKCLRKLLILCGSSMILRIRDLSLKSSVKRWRLGLWNKQRWANIIIKWRLIRYLSRLM